MKGLSHRTTSLGWDVFRWHYSADPQKDPSTAHGAAWLARAKKGVKDRDWRKEMEIDYRALGGQLVFPEYDDSIHVVEPFLPSDPQELAEWVRNWTVYQGADPHPRRAHAFVWLAVNRHGDKVVPWSYWPEALNREREENHKGRLTVSEYADRLKAIETAPLGLAADTRRVMDRAGHNFNADEELDYFQKYMQYDIHFWPAKANRDLSNYDSISEDLKPKPTDDGKLKPTLTIMRGCGDNDILCEQLRTLRFREWKGNVTDKDAPRDPQDLARHLIDCLGYIEMAGPTFIDTRRRVDEWKPIYAAIGY